MRRKHGGRRSHARGQAKVDADFGNLRSTTQEGITSIDLGVFRAEKVCARSARIVGYVQPPSFAALRASNERNRRLGPSQQLASDR